MIREFNLGESTGKQQKIERRLIYLFMDGPLVTRAPDLHDMPAF
jgi:hypothetical protein